MSDQTGYASGDKSAAALSSGSGNGITGWGVGMTGGMLLGVITGMIVALVLTRKISPTGMY